MDNEEIISILKKIARKLKRSIKLTIRDSREVGAYLLVILTSKRKFEVRIDDNLYYALTVVPFELSFEELFEREFARKFMFLFDPILSSNIDGRGILVIKCYIPRYTIKFHFKGGNNQFTWYYAIMVDKLIKDHSRLCVEANFKSKWVYLHDEISNLIGGDRNIRFFEYGDVMLFTPNNPMNHPRYNTIVIPTKEDLKDIINSFERSCEKDFTPYKDWKNENRPLAIDKEDHCELIEYLRYSVHVLFNKIWDIERRKWIVAPKLFKVNKFISLKLEDGSTNIYVDGSTNIYVDGRYFRQCKRLLFNLPGDSYEEYDEVNSIDDMAMSHPETMTARLVGITPEEEFLGHCSNLQTWEENGYDTRLLHSNLSFPLLRLLAFVGDVKAKRVYKEEIALRFETGIESTRTYLVIEGYLNYLGKEELQVLAENVDNFENWICFQMFKEYNDNLSIVGYDNLEAVLFNNPDYFDLLAKLADLGYFLCRNRLVEILSNLVEKEGHIVLIAVVKPLIRFFNDVDIEQLIQSIKSYYVSHPPNELIQFAFQAFLTAHVSLDIHRALNIFEEDLISSIENIIEGVTETRE